MIYVMSDIHGNLPFFRSVMRQIRLRKNDTLYILGDVIDRHPDGIKILKYIMKKANIRMLLGNHEYMMLNTLCKQTANGTNYYRAKRLWMKNGGKVTLDAFNRCHAETQEAILSFLKSLPLSFNIQVNDIYYKLVHGAPEEFFATSGGWYYDSLKEFCVWHRLKGTEEKSESMDYTLIFGHTPTCEYQSKNPPEIWTSPHGKMIGTDCGSGFPICEVPGKSIGRLACLRLDDERRTIQMQKKATNRNQKRTILSTIRQNGSLMYTVMRLRNSPKDRIYKHVQNENTSIFAMNLFPHFEHNTKGFIHFRLDIPLNL